MRSDDRRNEPNRARPPRGVARIARRAAKVSSWLLAVLVVVAGGLTLLLVPPRRGSLSLEDRLASFPTEGLDLRGRVEVFFDDYSIPFILAEHDDDVPYALGLVQAHLRLPQLAFLKRVARGRISEMVGPFTRAIDETLRLIDLDRAVPEMARRLPADTRRWIERFVSGVNDYRQRAPRTFEMRLLGIPRDEPFTLEDVLALGRLVSVDVNWLRWYRRLELRSEPRFEELMTRIAAFEARGRTSFGGADPTPLRPVTRRARTGSNSVAVAGSRTASGAALIASDPHLGISMPNLWLLVGYRSPAGGAAGMLYPGVPFVLIGRNDRLAWGGTNMHGLSTVLYDVSSLDASRYTQRRERIGVRLFPDRTVTLRDSPYGPVLTDAPLLRAMDVPEVALHWRGHEPSDEASAMFRAQRAGSFEELRRGFRDYAVSGQNLVVADVDGNIGQFPAIEFDPAAGRAAEAGPPVSPDDAAFRTGRGIPVLELPFVRNPESGYLVSCNNTPVRTDPPLTPNGNANDRIDRISGEIDRRGTIRVEDLMEIQQDVYSAASHRTARAIVARVADPSPWRSALAAWDGRYAADSPGAAAYQLALDRLLADPYTERYGAALANWLRSSAAVHDLVREDLAAGAVDDRALARVAERAARDFGEERRWGEIHRVRLAHPAAAVPLVGRRYRFADFGAPGSTTTVHKTAHAVTGRRHASGFGANARHVSDLSDPDANWFVLLGGQDGILGSEHYADQVPLFVAGEYIRVPLREETVRKTFPHRVVLE